MYNKNNPFRLRQEGGVGILEGTGLSSVNSQKDNFPVIYIDNTYFYRLDIAKQALKILEHSLTTSKNWRKSYKGLHLPKSNGYINTLTGLQREEQKICTWSYESGEGIDSPYVYITPEHGVNTTRTCVHYTRMQVVIVMNP